MAGIKVRQIDPPSELLRALEKVRLRYTKARDLYYIVWHDIDTYSGAFGDGDNAAYEWFVWNNGKLETSDVCYGSPSIALRDVLKKVDG